MVYKRVFCRTTNYSGIHLDSVNRNYRKRYDHLKFSSINQYCALCNCSTSVKCNDFDNRSSKSVLYHCFQYLAIIILLIIVSIIDSSSLVVNSLPTGIAINSSSSPNISDVAIASANLRAWYARLDAAAVANEETTNKFRYNRNTISVNSIDNHTTPSTISGFRLIGDSKAIVSNDERYAIKADHNVEARIFGKNFGKDFLIGFSLIAPNSKSVICSVDEKFEAIHTDDQTAYSFIKLPASSKPYHLCYSENLTQDDYFYYAGNDLSYQIESEAPLLPMWLHISLLLLLLVMSGLFSGLNLGLMALDKNELQVIERCGTEDEKYYAKTISPVRKRGNYLLCTLLLGNVLVNSTLTILLDDLTSGIFAVIGSTLLIVIFGEIIPQALCSRHGLAVGAKTVYVTYIFMFITFPLSYPISKLLDKILGEEIGSVYDRERLMEYIRVTKDYNNLEVDEMNIISGALKFKKISVADIMTTISDVFMLPYDTILNFDTLTLINNSGYSRIPIYEGNRDNIVGLLHVKDLSLIDPDHNLQLKVVLDFYSHPLLKVFEDDKLDKMLNEFKQGQSHMALIQRVIDNGVKDPYYESIGIVTLEDVIEELIQAEINDETDVISDNRRKQKRQNVQSRSNYLEFIREAGIKQKNDDDSSIMEYSNNVAISPQLALAAFRFLASSVGPFSSKKISEEVFKRLMNKNIYFEAKGEPRKPNIDNISSENILYKRGQPADYFIMILEGRARVIVTKENQEYDAGPFCCFGIGALTSSIPSTDDGTIVHNRSFNEESADSLSQKSSQQNISFQQSDIFIPDYTLICMEKVIYMKVTKDFYQMALKTTDVVTKRSSDLQKSQSQIEESEDSSENTTAAAPLIPVGSAKNDSLSRHLKNLPPKYRKISMGTNLADSSLMPKFKDKTIVGNQFDQDDEQMMSETLNNPRLRSQSKNSLIVDQIRPTRIVTSESLSNRRSSPTVRRSDAIELLTGNHSPRSYGSIESLTSDSQHQQQQSLLDNLPVPQPPSSLAPELKEKLSLLRNGSLSALDESGDHSQTTVPQQTKPNDEHTTFL